MRVRVCCRAEPWSRPHCVDDGTQTVSVEEVPVSDVRVLIVDDQELFRRAMATVVEATAGFTVVGSAATGEESLEMVEHLAPDLVLMDVNLPGIDGIEATRRMVATSDPPVIVLLSTYDEDQIDATGCGAVAYIPKAAFGPDRLSAVWVDDRGTAGQD